MLDTMERMMAEGNFKEERKGSGKYTDTNETS